MSILANIDFESGSFPAGVTANVSGTSTAAVSAGGLVGGSTQKGRVVQTSGNAGSIKVALGTLAGTSVGLRRSIGGYFKINSSSGDCRILRIVGNSDANVLASVSRVTGQWQLIIITNGGQSNKVILKDLADGIGHKFHLVYECSASADSSWCKIWIDDVFQAGLHFNGNAVTYGTGISHVHFGELLGTSSAVSIDFDGLYIGDALDPEVSSEGGLTGYSGPVAASTRTLQLSTTGTSPAWYSDDPIVATVDSTGLVTLQQATGGTVVIGDGLGSTQLIEFLARTVTWEAGAYTPSGSTLTCPINLLSTSDGHTTYADLWPSIVGTTVYLTGLTGTMPNLTATFLITGSAPYQIYLNGVLTTLVQFTATGTAALSAKSQTLVATGLFAPQVFLGSAVLATKSQTLTALASFVSSGIPPTPRILRMRARFHKLLMKPR